MPPNVNILGDYNATGFSDASRILIRLFFDNDGGRIGFVPHNEADLKAQENDRERDDCELYPADVVDKPVSDSIVGR